MDPLNLLGFCGMKYECLQKNKTNEKDEGEVAVFRDNRLDRRSREDLIEYVTPCHDIQVVRIYQGSSPVCIAVLTAV